MRLKLFILTWLVWLIFFPMTDAVYAVAEETVHQTYQVKAGTAVEIENLNGDIQVSAWDGEIVDVVAVKRSNNGKDALDTVTIEAENTGVLKIKTVYGGKEAESDFFLTRLYQRAMSGLLAPGSKVSVRFTVKIPRNVQLIAARTLNGDVTVTETQGDSKIKSTNGDIHVERTRGLIDAETTNGSVSVLESSGLRRAGTVNGNIDVTFPKLIETDAAISSVNGSITLNAASDTDANLDFKTVNGKISAEGFSVTNITLSSRRLIGTLRNGGRTIKAHTVNGSVRMGKWSE